MQSEIERLLSGTSTAACAVSINQTHGMTVYRSDAAEPLAHCEPVQVAYGYAPHEHKTKVQIYEERAVERSFKYGYELLDTLRSCTTFAR